MNTLGSILMVGLGLVYVAGIIMFIRACRQISKPPPGPGYLQTCAHCGEIHNQPTCPMCGGKENRKQ